MRLLPLYTETWQSHEFATCGAEHRSRHTGAFDPTRQDNLSRDAANYLLSIRFDDNDIARMDELSESARNGTLSAAEEAELDSYIHVGNLLAVMQSKARQALRVAKE